MSFWAVSLANFVLLAENRLSLSTEDTVTPLRTGFFVQYLLFVGWSVLFYGMARRDPAIAFGVLGLVHVGVVAVFVLTEEMSVPRRVLQRMRVASGWRRLLTLFGPGAGRGAAYVLAQMAVVMAVIWSLPLPANAFRLLLAACGYILFFTGVPVLVCWRFLPARSTTIVLRVAVLLFVAAVLVLPDIIHYVITQPEILDIAFGARHLINPFMTFEHWRVVESNGWHVVVYAIGATGLLAYVQLMRLGAQATARIEQAEPRPVPVTGEAGRGGILY
jgi:hypothetical protein